MDAPLHQERRGQGFPTGLFRPCVFRSGRRPGDPLIRHDQVSDRLRGRGITAILLDIEGTTTPIAFVYDVLFPFARARLRSYVHDDRHSEEVDQIASTLKAEHAADVVTGARPPLWLEASRDERLTTIEAYALWLMDRDRKSPGLKRLQGQIWEIGFQAGELKGEVFPDVAPAIRRCGRLGLTWRFTRRAARWRNGGFLSRRRMGT